MKQDKIIVSETSFTSITSNNTNEINKLKTIDEEEIVCFIEYNLIKI